MSTTKYVFVTGGVTSSLGKGIIAASLAKLLQELSRAKKQREAVLTFFQLSSTKNPIKAKDLEEKAAVSSMILKSLVDKNIFEFYNIQTDRIQFKGDINSLKLVLILSIKINYVFNFGRFFYAS